MENNNQPPEEQESLGGLFRRLRLERSLDIKQVAEETRIPPKTIRAIESDYYDALPPNAFARGFYSLYAKMLDLDQTEILERYDQERNAQQPSRQLESTEQNGWKKKNVGTISSRPTFTVGSVIGSSLILLIIISGGISWYAGFNPATYISKWLRDFQEKPEIIETTGEGDAQLSEQGAESSYNYQLVVEFLSESNVTVIIDGSAEENTTFPAGTIKTWGAQENLIIRFPAGSDLGMRFNGVTVPIPPASGNTVSISLPESILD